MFPHLRIVADTGKAYPAYRFREAACDNCDGSGLMGSEWSDGFPDTVTCDECSGSGDTEAACAYCARIAPLDGEGSCRDCNDESVVELPSGWSRICL